MPTHIEISANEYGLNKDSVILLEQIRTIDKKRLREKVGKVDEKTMEKVITANAPAAIGPYSQGMIWGDLVFTSGQIPINPATGNVEATTIEQQTEQVCKNISAVLTAAGTSVEKVVKTVCFLSDMNDFAAFNAVYAKYFTGKPARSCVAVKTLPKNVLVEVDTVAEV